MHQLVNKTLVLHTCTMRNQHF